MGKVEKGKCGFTLFETMIVIGLVILISVVLVPYTVGFYESRVFNEEVETMLDILKRAQSYAISGKLDSDWGVQFTRNEERDGYKMFRGSDCMEDQEIHYDFELPPGGEIDESKCVVFLKNSGEPLILPLEEEEVLRVATRGFSEVGDHYAEVDGYVENDAGDEEVDRYFEYGETENLEGGEVDAGEGGVGSFSARLEGLDINTRYYFRACGESDGETDCGEIIGFNTGTLFTECGTQNFTDPRDGSEYPTVEVGDTCWVAENMRYLPEVYPPWDSHHNNPRYYVYGYEGSDVSEAMEEDNYKEYGALYNQNAARTELCPTIWDLPTDEDYKELEEELGMSDEDLEKEGWRGGPVGEMLKEGGASGWEGRLAGFYYEAVSDFVEMEEEAIFWTSSMQGMSAWVRRLRKGETGVKRERLGVPGHPHTLGDAVAGRCIIPLDEIPDG